MPRSCVCIENAPTENRILPVSASSSRSFFFFLFFSSLFCFPSCLLFSLDILVVPSILLLDKLIIFRLFFFSARYSVRFSLLILLIWICILFSTKLLQILSILCDIANDINDFTITCSVKNISRFNTRGNFFCGIFKVFPVSMLLSLR